MKTVLQNLRANRIAAKRHKKRKRGPECIAAKRPRDRNNYISSANVKADLLLDREANLYPDLVLSAHSHLYQRITYQQTDGRQIPHLIIGSGGHPPIEPLFETCTKTLLEQKPPPLDLVWPAGLDLPEGESPKVVAYNDTDFGFTRVTIDLNSHKLTGEFFAVLPSGESGTKTPRVADSFVLDLVTKRIA